MICLVTKRNMNRPAAGRTRSCRRRSGRRADGPPSGRLWRWRAGCAIWPRRSGTWRTSPRCISTTTPCRGCHPTSPGWRRCESSTFRLTNYAVYLPKLAISSNSGTIRFWIFFFNTDIVIVSLEFRSRYTSCDGRFRV